MTTVIPKPECFGAFLGGKTIAVLPIRHHLRGKFILNQDARRNVRLSVFAQIHPLPSVPVTTLPKTNNVYPKSWFGKGGTPLYQICPFFGIYESMFDFRVCVKDDTPPPRLWQRNPWLGRFTNHEDVLQARVEGMTCRILVEPRKNRGESTWGGELPIGNSRLNGVGPGWECFKY